MEIHLYYHDALVMMFGFIFVYKAVVKIIEILPW